MIIYMPGERIPIQIDGLKVEITQLTQAQKIALVSLLAKAENDVAAAMEASRKAIQFAVKSVSGLQLSDGSDFQVELENDQLSEQSVEALLNLKCSQKIQGLCMSLMSGFSGDIVDGSGKSIPGVSLIKTGTKKRKN